MLIKGEKGSFRVEFLRLNGKSWSFSLPRERYLYYAKKRHRKFLGDPNIYHSYVTPHEDSIQKIVYEILSYAGNGKLTKVEKAEILLDATRRIPYESKEGGSYLKFPIETLCERGGDCGDLSIVGATFLTIAQIRSGFIHFLISDEKNPADHVAIGVALEKRIQGGWYHTYRGKNYFIGEVSGTTFSHEPSVYKLGDVPKNIKLDNLIFVPNKLPHLNGNGYKNGSGHNNGNGYKNSNFNGNGKV